jgi:hypothetical protein
MFDECHPDTVFECNANTFSITEAERNTGGLTQSIYHAKNIASSGQTIVTVRSMPWIRLF